MNKQNHNDNMIVGLSPSARLKLLASFLIPSLLGIFFFIIPIPDGQSLSIPVALWSKYLLDFLSPVLPMICVHIIVLAALGSLLIKTPLGKKLADQSHFFKLLFELSPMWLAARLTGACFALLIYFEMGPSLIRSEQTGGLLLFELIPMLFCVFVFAAVLLPLLLDFGLLEFCGVIFTKVMRPVFTLPGRSAIDCLTSWLGDGTIGVMLTSKQFEGGFYTQREACVIGTTFSLVSITFMTVIMTQMGLEHKVMEYYFTIFFTSFIAALICPRIPPLSLKKDQYFNNRPGPSDKDTDAAGGLFKKALQQALIKASGIGKPKDFLLNGFKNMLEMWFAVLPVVLSVGTIALLVAKHTAIFDFFALPLTPLFKFFEVPYAQEASKALVVGFADMFLPTILASQIPSELTRFIVACSSVTQLIYLSEVGGLLLSSKIPVDFKDLVLIFIQRNLITLPIIILLAKSFF